MPLPVKLPLLPAAMQELTALVKDQGITGGFKEDDGSAAQLAYVLSGAVTGKLFVQWEQEPLVADAVNQCIVKIIMTVDDLLPFEDRLGLVFSRDRGDTESGMTNVSANGGNLRPDGAFFLKGNRMGAKLEEKDNTYPISQPLRELGEKTAVWSPLYYGSLPYLLCIAIAGSLVQFCAVERGAPSTAVAIGAPYDMQRIGDRAALAIATFNFFRLLKAASAYLPSSVLTVGCDLKHKVTLDGGSSYTRTLHFLSDSLAVQKSITPWPVYAERWGVQFSDIALAYSATSTASGLIHVSPNGGEPTLNGGKYLVQLGPLGLQRADIRVASESQLRNAAHGILHGLNALHQAELVHRDLRWPNLACDMESASRFYLLDLEMCARADCKPAMAHPPAHWGPHALVGSLYTAASDLHCMGVMLRQYVNLATSDNARNFLGIVSAHAKDLRESAVELLQHPWISCAGAACTAAGALQGEV
ncbi:hypothetical protein JKP88DRAFT_196792 [Tribonema minus]|uniref:Protein kinase domain-containing protein n=1 Tax=Tribonema minus TaxID=303371 RepID=A0A835YJL1_9STRA|nr:hypothetical protein JKP88DRAFT_196792 [Tribonema minus]